jgi:hypothetical protein
MGTAAGMLDVMRSLLGTREDRGNNHNFITDWYADREGSIYRATAWCDITVSYAAAQSGNLDAVMGDQAWTPSHARAFERAGRWHTGADGIQPGDIVFYDWGGSRSIDAIDHVEVVESVNADGTFVTIGGNVHDRVERVHRGTSDVVGYGRPAYDGSPAPTVQVPVPLEVDGVFGPLTCRALQRALNVQGYDLVVDGEFGPLTKRALQRYLGVAVDGAIGPISTRALQRHVGASQDGQWGPQTTRCLQGALNAGAF